MLTETCCQIDLIPLFENGFSTGHGFLREPNSIESYAALACIAIQANQNEMHGGQSVPNFDWAMARGVAKTYGKEYRRAFTAWLRIRRGLGLEEAGRLTETALGACGLEPGLGLEAEMEADMKGANLPIGPEDALAAHAYAAGEAARATENRVYQSMEALVHNLNTMNSRAGAQVPFSSIRRVNKAEIREKAHCRSLHGQLEQVIVRVFRIIVEPFLDLENLHGKDRSFAVAKAGLGGQEQVFDDHTAFRGGIRAIVYGAERHLGAGAGIHCVEVVNQGLH